jgi:hypothetical protein
MYKHIKSSVVTIISLSFLIDGEQDFSDDSDQTENDHEDEPEMESNDSNTGGVNEMLALANHSRSAGQNGPLAVRRRSKVHNTGSMQLFQTSHSSFGTNATSESGNLCVDLQLIDVPE